MLVPVILLIFGFIILNLEDTENDAYKRIVIPVIVNNSATMHSHKSSLLLPYNAFGKLEDIMHCMASY